MTLTTWEAPLAVSAGGAVVRLPSLDELADEWPTIAPMLRKATQRTGCYEPIDILRLAMAGQLGVWVCEVDGEITAVIVTEVKQYPRKRVLEMLFCGGCGMRHWLEPAIAVIDEHARACGCTLVCCLGRHGWARAWRGRLTGDVLSVREV